MICYTEISQNFDEFRKIFMKASHAPFKDVELVQGKRNFRNRINSATGLLERISQTPDNFEAKVVLKRDLWTDENPYFDLTFKIRSDGSIFCDSRAKYKNQPSEKWAKLIQRWLKDSVSTYRTYRRTDQIREELVSTVFYKQLENAQLYTETCE